MSRYINADRLEKDGWSLQRIRQVSPTEMVYETKKPTDFPAADVVEVRHGYWVNDNHLIKCSICGSPIPVNKVVIHGEIMWEDNRPVKYCPNCGAKMMNEDEEMSKVSEMEMAYGEYLND